MKSIAILTIVATAVILAIVIPPGTIQARPALGIKAGLNLANWQGRNYAGTDIRTCFSGGGYVVFGVSPRVSVQAEILYTMKGTTAKEHDIATASKLSYIEVPLLARLATTRDEKVSPYFIIGPALAFELTSKIKTGGDEWDSEEVCMDTKSPDIAIVLGTGVEFGLAGGKGKMSFEIRYVMGLRSINDSPAICCEPAAHGGSDECSELGGPFDIKNRVIAFSVGLTM